MPVNPEVQLSRVFVFLVRNGLAEGRSIYDATRSAWRVKPSLQSLPAYAVGIDSGISVGSFEIRNWNAVGNKSEFNGTPYLVLQNLKWTKVIAQALGFWQRGNYLLVEFDGDGKFKVLRGAGPDSNWIDCV